MAEIGNVTVRVDAVITDEQYREAMGAIKAANERMDLLEAENEKLQDENERLRSCLSDSAENSKQIMHEAHVQEEENAKLRELVRVFYHCTTSGVCDECPVNGGGAVHLMPDTICDTMHDRMRELGFEVEQ